MLSKQPCIGQEVVPQHQQGQSWADRRVWAAGIVFTSCNGPVNFQTKPYAHNPEHQNHRGCAVLCCWLLLTSYICTTMPRFLAGAISAR